MSASRKSAAILAVAASGVFAQSVVRRPAFTEFDVVSVKLSAPDASGRWIRMQSTHEFAARNHTVKTLIAAAYNLNPRAISGGPEWVDSDHFDIVAKAPK